jgi:hypothetical protein
MAADSGGSTKPVAVIILGADALLAGRPATPIQLWHACLAAGYDLAVPATWGDELVAAECLRAVGSHPETVAVMCSCPMVARAIGDGDADLTGHLVSLVAPPVATARYLRRVYGERRVHITFVGACPAAGDSAIDAWLTPGELLERFIANEIALDRQPQLFESVLPPDRRRHLSQPGGVPTVESAGALARARQVVEVNEADVMASIRRHLMSSVRTLVDCAPRLGCTCSGAIAGLSSVEARAAVMQLEPPRSTRPVMTDPGGLGLLRRVHPRPATAAPPIRRPAERAAARGGRDDTARPEDRPVATPRSASRSPLSWNLRERALPGLTSRPAHLAPDAATIAAARALESAAHAVAGGDVRPPPEPTVPAPTATAASAESSDAPAARAPGAAETSARAPRPTPPGGYWFVGAPGPDSPDSEVQRAPPSIEDGSAGEANDRSEVTELADVPMEAAESSDEEATPPPAAAAPQEPVSREEPVVQSDDEDAGPDRPWVVAMTIILLIAGGLVAHDVVQRRTAEPSVAEQADSANVYTGVMTDVVTVSPPGVAPGLDSIGRVVGTLFIGRPGADHVRVTPTPQPLGR